MDEKYKITLSNIIKRVEGAKYNQAPEILLEAKELLKDDRNIDNVKSTFWNTGFMKTLSAALARDYLKVKNDWLAASKICDLLIECCQMNKAANSNEEFRKVFLPELCKNMWILLHNVHSSYKQNKGEKRLEVSFRNVSVNIYVICKDNKALAIQSFNLPEMLKILKSETSILDLTFLELCSRLSKVDRAAVASLPGDKRLSIFNIMVSKFVTATDIKIASLSLNFVLTWIEQYPQLISLIVVRKNEIDAAVEKWKGRNFDANLRKVSHYLETKAAEQNDKDIITKAAMIIQAGWRSYSTRKKLAKMKAGFITLIQLFRSRRQERLATEKQNELSKQRQFETNLKTVKDNVNFLQRQYQAISSVHPSLVDRYLEERGDVAAGTIQAAWRGHRTRKRLGELKQRNIEHQAAKTIQKSIRKYAERNKRLKYRLREWPELTEERREQLQKVIDRYNNDHKYLTPPNLDDLASLHTKCEIQLKNHYSKRLSELNSYQHREALLARLQLDSDLMENSPKLEEVTEKDVIMFGSRNSAVALAALYAHRKALNQESMPKWKQLIEKLDFNEENLTTN